MGEPIVFITGLPRSGTTLTTELLGGLPDCVAIDEPIHLDGFIHGATPAPRRGATISAADPEAAHQPAKP